MNGRFRLFVAAFFCWLSFGSVLHAQTLKGRITDTNGKPVGDASLFVKELKLGTAANIDGFYELKVPEGTYTCTFQCLGYDPETRNVTIDRNTVVLDISLREKAYELKEVIISDKKEDPAYGIMRRAIAMAPYYLNQVSEYKADLYLKGSLHIIKISRLVKRLAKEELEGFKEGNTYLEESYNEIEFTAPNKYRQKVLKKTGNFPKDNGGINAMELITASVYDPQAILPNISPLSSSAFAHYRFRYEGFSEESGRVVNKIKITPIHKSKQLISGYIYIADNYWNVAAVDVTGEFVIGGDYRLQINFGEVTDDVWLPVSHRIDFNGSILGNKGSFHYVSSVKYTHMTENASLRKPDALVLAEQQRKAMQRTEAPPLALTPASTETKSKTAKKIEEISAKEDLSNREAYKLARLMQKEADAKKKESQSLDLTATLYEDYKVTVDSNAAKRDTAYWEKMRPVPLTPSELKGYQEKEIQQTGTFRVPTNDSAKHQKKSQSPFVKTSKKVLLGTDINIGKKGGTVQYRGLKPSRLGFNTVDGFFIGQKLTYYKDFAEKRRENRLTVTPEVVWAINRRTVRWNTNAGLTYAPLRRGNIHLAFGQTTTDFNEFEGIHPFENTVASLFFRRNYQKLYKNDYIRLGNAIDIANGLQLTTDIQYARRKMLDNVSDYSFFYRDAREYTTNIPVNAELTEPPVDHTAASFSVRIDYTPRSYYRIDRNNRKRPVKSDFPTFSVGWRKGVKNMFGSDCDFDHLNVGVYQSIETGLMQKLTYSLRGGMFVNDKSVFFPDFKHFRTVEIPVTMGTIEGRTFNLLEYYRYDTSDKYAEVHVSFTAPFLVLKYLPFFNNRLWEESLLLNYLYTPEMKNYIEAGYTIGLFWKAGIFVGFENFKYRSVGAKLSIPIARFVN